MKKVKAYCVIRNSKKPRVKVNNFVGGIKLEKFGSNENPFFYIHPFTERGLQMAESSCNGYEQVAECEITIKRTKEHKCNCKHCGLK